LERSNNNSRTPLIVLFDRGVLALLLLGLALYVLPTWREGRLRYAFWLTLVATILHVYSSHARGKAES
jgi:hypothetical protein